MNWISVKDKLPVIPEGMFAVTIIGAQQDPVWAEINNGDGYSIGELSYDNEGFKTMYVGGPEGSGFMPVCDEVTHWMPRPDSPVYI